MGTSTTTNPDAGPVSQAALDLANKSNQALIDSQKIQQDNYNTLASHDEKMMDKFLQQEQINNNTITSLTQSYNTSLTNMSGQIKDMAYFCMNSIQQMNNQALYYSNQDKANQRYYQAKVAA